MLRKTPLLLLASHASGTQVNLADTYGSTASDDVLYTSNPVCIQKNCINPVTPGLMDLPRLEGMIWQCTKPGDARKYIQFCGGAVDYDPAVPSGTNQSVALDHLVDAQDGAASTMFFYHLNALGYDAWEFTEPHKSGDPCVQRVYELTCFTYFPKQQADCTPEKQVPFQRPCRDTCEAYLGSCQVRCCDGSATCVFEQKLEGGSTLSGYVDQDGPSAICTGSGSNRIAAPVVLLLALLGLHVAGSAPEGSARPAGRGGFGNYLLLAVLTVCAASLQGCTVGVPSHRVPNWKKESDYLVQFEHVPDGQPETSATLNSCNAAAEGDEVCSGRGECKQWSHLPLKLTDSKVVATGVSFCKCESQWADPECRTRRKSQFKAFLLSLFTGFLGLDRFYLGLYLTGCAKLVSLGGLGVWWLYDIVRVGSAPVYARDFKVADDLPFWLYLLVVLLVFGALGLLYSLDSYARHRRKKNYEVMHIFSQEESRNIKELDEPFGHDDRNPWGSRSGRLGGYGSMLPAWPGAGTRLS
eukprot:gb/GFBE01032793.1/.p1 GENE.gb/GFBE01032793.1/~~gb/GFBE01032793.1/.p1  ORF type:complete len:525 (+),score=96.37 gb/GFBE01032793.1/:1-1575(+)